MSAVYVFFCVLNVAKLYVRVHVLLRIVAGNFKFRSGIFILLYVIIFSFLMFIAVFWLTVLMVVAILKLAPNSEMTISVAHMAI